MSDRGRRSPVRLLALAVAISFIAGVIAATWFWRFRENSEPETGAFASQAGATAPSLRPAEMPDDVEDAAIQARQASETPGSLSGVRSMPPGDGAPLPMIERDPVAELREKGLRLPIEGADPKLFRQSFQEVRGGRMHQAADILAPRNTPVVAVEGGKIAKLFYSQAGGITLYQFDPQERFVYYYAHLERYAPNLREGDRLSRGQVLGYVGTSGNAPPEAPHLHFAIFKLTEKKRWWEGTPIDPYGVFR